MASIGIKEEYINKYYLSMRAEVRNGYEVYNVTLAVDYGNIGLFSKVRDYTSPDRKKALATYNRYKRAIQA